jgi:hypothetical protein
VPHPRAMAKVAILNAPGLVAVALLWWLRREALLGRLSAAVLAVWVAVPALFLARHYACALLPIGDSRACRAFVVPVHHWHLYLVTAWAVLIGLATWGIGQRASRRADGQEVLWRRHALAVVGAGLLALGIAAMLTRPFDRAQRSLLPADSAVIAAEAYHWILANTPPEAVFAVPDRYAMYGEPEAFTVIAAGRALVAAPRAFSNPFAAWEPKEALRRRVLETITGAGPADLPCAMVSAGLYAMLSVDDVVDRGRTRVALRSEAHVIYQVTKGACADGLD